MSVVEEQSRVLEECLDSVKQWNELINKYCDADQKDGLQNSIRDITKIYAHAKFEAEIQDDAIKRIENHLAESGEDEQPDLKVMFQTLLGHNTSEFDLMESDVWCKVFGVQDVQEVQQERGSINDSKFERLDDSIMCSEVFKVPVDPLTKKNITEPCRNKRCKHIYDYTSILGYIKSMKRKAKCPYVGCGNHELRATDLIKDEALQRQILEYSSDE